MFLTRISVNHPVFATMVMLALVVIGAVSYSRLAIEQFPPIDFPIVAILTEYTGAAPETVEQEVTRVIENAVGTAGGIDNVTSTSAAGRSTVIARFDLSMKSATAAQEVRDRIAAIEASLPDAAARPQVLTFDPAQLPILSVALSSETMALADLTTLADRAVVPRLTAIAGVGRATLVGGVRNQVLIVVDDAQLRSLSIGINDVANAIRAENRNLPAGAITYGALERTVQVEGKLIAARDFLDVIVARRGGQPIYLHQVAAVTQAESTAGSRALLDGKRALAIDLVQVQGANTVETAANVQRELTAIAASLPAGVRLFVVRDNSTAIRASVDSVRNTLIEGAALAIAIVFLFLNSWRSTVITGITLPVSVIGTFAALYFLGFTLNIMTLMALSLAIGILIDDAIVVRENIMRHLHMGKSHRRAALEGTAEIGLAVLATTLSIVAVFLPVAFMGGIVGRFFLQFGVTVSVAVLISLLVSFTIDPMLSSVWYDPAARRDARRGPVGRFVGLFNHGFEALRRGYGVVLRQALRHRLTTVGLAFVLFAASIALVPSVGVEFIPQSDTGQFTVRVRTPPGSALVYTEAKVLQAEEILRSQPAIASTYTTINAASANISVRLVPLAQRAQSTNEVTAQLRDRLAGIAGVEATISQPGVGGGGSPVQLSILGPEIEVLTRLSANIVEAVRGVPGTADVTTSLSVVRPILAVRVKRDIASELGVSSQQISAALRPLLAGEQVSTWNAADGTAYDVVVRLREDARNDLASLQGLPITTSTMGANGAPTTVRLDQVADITNAFGPAEIVRRDLAREVRVSAAVAGRVVGQVTAEVRAAVAAVPMPPGYRISYGGEAANLADSAGAAITAVVLAVLFIYFVLASQFGSFLQPVAIMISLPLALIGVVIGLLATGSTLNMMSVIGFVTLMGLVTKNAILLVDYANRCRAGGMSLYEALLTAGSIRFRPIVMTTTAMIFGMLPLALGLGEGSETSAPMAHAVIGGLVSSMLLTLVVVPVIVTYLDGLVRRIRWMFPRSAAEGEESSPEPGVANVAQADR